MTMSRRLLHFFSSILVIMGKSHKFEVHGLWFGLLMLFQARLVMWAAFLLKTFSSSMLHKKTVSSRLLHIFPFSVAVCYCCKRLTKVTKGQGCFHGIFFGESKIIISWVSSKFLNFWTVMGLYLHIFKVTGVQWNDVISDSIQRDWFHEKFTKI